MNKKIKAILFFTGITTATIHLINRLEYSRSTSINTLTYIDNNYYEWRFGKIRYTKNGSGTPLLLLHDLKVGSSSYEYHKLINKLSKKHEVYSIDFIGYGASDKTNMTYTNYLFVQQITDFIKTVIKRKTNIIACGDATPVAIMACHNDNEIIQNIIAINPQSLYQLNYIPSKQTRFLKFIIDTPILGTFIYNLYTSKTAFKHVFKKEYFNDPYNIDGNDISSYMESSHTPDHCSKYAYTSYVGRYTNANIVHALKEINNSIYIIAGEDKKDSHTTVQNYEYYNNAIESVFIPNTKHLPHLEKPEKVLSYLKMYLT